MKKSDIFVTKPSLPPLKDLVPYLEQIWNNKIVSNNGPFHKQLEDALCNYLRVPYVSLVCNGTIGLIIALKALEIKGEVITTPYSFVATANSLIMNNLKPIFVDIDPETLNLDPNKIERAITKNTSAIMPVHVYGHACDVEAIDKIAKKYHLKVIYDASHAFGVKRHSGSLLNYGDLSVLSFHATKVFNTFEGGAIICQSADIKRKIDEIKNFGFSSEITIDQIGINGKMNEFSAALGLLQLNYIDTDIEKRKTIDEAYREGLKNVKGISCHIQAENLQNNYSYFPIFVEDNYPLTRDQLYTKLKENGINGRRYFYPLITEFSAYNEMVNKLEDNLLISKKVSEQVICLPIYSEMEPSSLMKVLSSIC